MTTKFHPKQCFQAPFSYPPWEQHEAAVAIPCVIGAIGISIAKLARLYSRNLPAVVVASHITAVVYLTLTLFLGLYKTNQNLNPSQDIRQRVAKRAHLNPDKAQLASL